MTLANRKDKAAVQFAKDATIAHGAPVRYATKHDLNMLTSSRPHQVQPTASLGC